MSSTRLNVTVPTDLWELANLVDPDVSPSLLLQNALRAMTQIDLSDKSSRDTRQSGLETLVQIAAQLERIADSLERKT